MTMNNGNVEIKACPFCGSTKVDIAIKRNNGKKSKVVYMKCYNCYAQGPRLTSEAEDAFYKSDEAIKLWNKRKEIKEKIVEKRVKPSSIPFITNIKQFFNKIIINKKLYDERKQLFNDLKIGDVVYAQMPLSKKRLLKIEEGHRERPYVVVKKGKDKIYAYKCTGKQYSKLKSYQSYFFNKDIYDNGKHSYIELNTVYELPIKNLRFKYKTLYTNTLEKINKRLMISHYYRRDLLMFPDIKVEGNVGDFILKDENIYYVYKRYEDILYTYKVYLKNIFDLKYKYCCVKLDNHRYYISIDEKEEIDVNDDYCFIGILPESKYECIENAKQEYKSYKQKQRKYDDIVNNYSLKYPIGQTFYLGMEDYLYLYHHNNNMYVLEKIDGEFDCMPIIIGNERHLTTGICLKEEDVLKIFNEVIELDEDKHGIVEDIVKNISFEVIQE